MAGLSRPIRLKNFLITLYGVSYNPRKTSLSGLGYIPVRSPLLRKSLLLSLPLGTEMFQFPRYTSLIL